MADEKEEDLLKKDQCLRDRWDVIKKLGGGGFGQIYVAFDKKENCEVALKAEVRSANFDDVLIMEVNILNEMKGKPHFCKVFGCGQDPKFNFLVMELCGPSLSELRKKSPFNCFSLSCAFQITTQCVEALKHLHQAGYLHRDIKPSNYAIGKEGRNPRMIYILDFGLSRKYISESTKQIRKPREEVGFRGTVRYASITIHKGKELARVDDLWSVFYMLVEMTAGKLPWRNETDKHKVLSLKMSIGNRQLVQRFPKSILAIIDHLDGLDYLSEPNYNFICMCIRQGIFQEGFSGNEPWDWENNWANCTKASTYVHTYQPEKEKEKEKSPPKKQQEKQPAGEKPAEKPVERVPSAQNIPQPVPPEHRPEEDFRPFFRTHFF